MLAFHCCKGFSLLAEWWLLCSGDSGFLTVVASLVVEHGLQNTPASVLAQKLSCWDMLASSWIRDQTHVSHIGRGILYH